ncbi:MAG: GNAT family N-acetyltransferase [Williamsia sp.]|nr:GNAT family N-acetyltransferase [Williamsia sp.]
MHYEWRCKRFAELTPYELYALLKLRSEVFVVEQNCVYLDIDGKDPKGFHLVCWSEEEVLACTRLLPAGVSYGEMSIGRVATAYKVRRFGLGRELMQQSIRQCYQLFGEAPIRIGAQLYLRRFYESFNFVQASPVYLEDGIEHIEMVLSTPNG